MLLFRNGEESIEVNVQEDLNDDTYQISHEEVVRILKQDKFNDDEFGQICASYDGPDDDDMYWIYVEDTSDENEFEMFDDYNYFYLVPDATRGTELVTNWENEVDFESENDLHLEKRQHLLSFKKFNESFNDKIDMKWLE